MGVFSRSNPSNSEPDLSQCRADATLPELETFADRAGRAGTARKGNQYCLCSPVRSALTSGSTDCVWVGLKKRGSACDRQSV